LWNGEIGGACFQNTLLRLRPNAVEPEYLRYALLNDAISGRLGAAARGVGIHHLGARRLSSWEIALPPAAEQQRIVATLDSHLLRIRRIREAVTQACDKAAVLRTALFDRAARGEAAPQDSSEARALGVLEGLIASGAPFARRPGRDPFKDATLPSLPSGWLWLRGGGPHRAVLERALRALRVQLQVFHPWSPLLSRVVLGPRGTAIGGPCQDKR
jgi:type I restriction enzyme S subunit